MQRSLALLATLLVALAALGGCAYEPPQPFTESQTLGGVDVDPVTLNTGRMAYEHYCLACHGRDGDGRGLAARDLRPPPRDFRLAVFKFAGVSEGELPHDEDIAAIVHEGLDGTAMLRWTVAEDELHALIQYLKTFSPEGEGWRDPDMEVGERIVAGDDPWAGKIEAGIERGKAVYHGMAGCNSCHPSYATAAETNAYRKTFSKPEAAPRPSSWLPEAKESETYSRPIPGDPACDDATPCGDGQVCRFGRCEEKLRIVPPDFAFSQIRRGQTPAEVFRVLAAGIPGTAMPRWKDSLPDEDIWAMAHFVFHLRSLRGTAEATQLHQRIKADAGGGR